MEGVLDRDRAAWRSVLATFFWLLVTIGGLSLVVALQPIFFAVGRAMMSGDATAVVSDKYRIVSANNFGVVFYGMVWLGGTILLQSYYVRAKSVRQLLGRFGVVALAEAGVWGLSFVAQSLVMR